MKKVSLYLAVAAMASLTLSCKKDSDTAAPASKADLLTAKKWRVSAASTSITSNNQTSTVDDYATSPACERDDFAQFNANKSVTFDEGATKCSSTDPQTTMGTWDFNSDQTKLTLTDPNLGGLALPFDIVTLNATTLSLRFTSTQQGGSAVINRTFTSF